MAEGIMRKRLTEEGLAGLDVSSMGIHAIEGNAATGPAVEVCRENAIDIGQHRSRALVPEEMKASRFIFTMEQVQSDYIDLFFPQVSDRLFMLSAWPERKRKKGHINDPVGGSIEVYRKTFRQLSGYIDELMPELLLRYGDA